MLDWEGKSEGVSAGISSIYASMARNAKAATLREAIEEAKMMDDMYVRDKQEKEGMGENREWEKIGSGRANKFIKKT